MSGFELTTSPPARVLRLNKRSDLVQDNHFGGLSKPYRDLSNVPEARPKALLRELDDHLALRSYSRKSYVYLPLENTDKIYAVRRGFVEIGVLSPDGRELVVDILAEGEIFGSILNRKSEGEFARVIGPAVLGDMNRGDVEILLQKQPELAMVMLGVLEDRKDCLFRKVQNLVFQDVKGRICQLLLDLHQKCGASNGRIPIALTHQDIANMVASSRETASLHLSELKKNGILDYNRRYIQILSAKELTRMAA